MPARETNNKTMLPMHLNRKPLLVTLALATLIALTGVLLAAPLGAAPLLAAAQPIAPAWDAPAPAQGGLIDTITGKTGSASATSTAVAQLTATPAAIEVVIVTPTPSATLTPTLPTNPAASPASNPVSATSVDGVIEGTVIANRTGATVQFFVEGTTWQLDPLRSAGVSLGRATAVLNLFNCDAGATSATGSTGSDAGECFWDPYLLQRDGFYEVVAGAEENALVSLVLRTAGAPPTDQIWIQNRSGQAEQVYFGAEMRDLAPASVTEFTIDPTAASVFYLRTCVANGGESACEWTATDAEAGTYYALVSDTWQSGLPGATVTALELSPILGSGVAALTASAAAPADTADAASANATAAGAADSNPAGSAAAGSAGANLVCTLAVPTLNVRSGPGLAFEVISKIMTTGDTPATISVVGRTQSNEWLQVDARQANGGWIINGDAYITCPAATATLAVVPDSALPATPTPGPLVATQTDNTAADTASGDSAGDSAGDGASDGAGDVTVETAPQASGPPAGYALITVQNAFEQPVRFTLDQRYRVAEGPSEVDLVQGQSTSFVVFPGVVAFSASSAWRNLSGNAELLLEADQQRSLYLIFVPDPGEEGKWIFQY